MVFGAADSDFSPSVGEALTDNPFAGFWTDLNPHPVNGGGNIIVDSSAPGVVRVNYNGVIYYGEFAAPNTFAVVMDTTNGDLTLDGLTGIANNPAVVGSVAGDAQFFGISGGLAVGATDAGTTSQCCSSRAPRGRSGPRRGGVQCGCSRAACRR